MASPAPAKDEFIKVALDMGLAQAVVDALGPRLEVKELAVNPAQDLVRLLAGDDFGLMGVRGRILIADPAVRDYMRAKFDCPANETTPRTSGATWDDLMISGRTNENINGTHSPPQCSNTTSCEPGLRGRSLCNRNARSRRFPPDRRESG